MRLRGASIPLILGLSWCLAQGQSTLPAPTLPWDDIAPGLSHLHLQQAGPLSIHLLRVDPKSIQILPVRAWNNGIGRETVSSMARRSGAVAAVNGGFFAMGGRYDGDPAGLLKIGRAWYSDSSLMRGSVGWTRDGKSWAMDRLVTHWELHLGERILPVTAINRSRRDNEAVVYTWDFHRSTLTDPEGLELLVRNDSILERREGGDSPIPQGGFVYSVGPKLRSSLQALEAPLSGRRARLAHRLSGATDPDWEKMDFIVGGAPLLLKKGETDDFGPERLRAGFASERHPRTALGIRPDGVWIFLVADGRQPDHSLGMTLAQVRTLLAGQGCTSALNLDGGGSSVLILKDRVANRPSDLGEERAVSDAIILKPRAPIRSKP